MRKVVGYSVAVIVLLGTGIGLGFFWKNPGPPITQLRWKNETEVKAEPNDRFKELRAKDPDPAHHPWEKPTVSVYSAPYAAPHPLPVTLKDLSDNGQAHAIDFVLKGPTPPKTTWQELMSVAGDDASAPERVDPYRVNRVLIATVAKGLDTLPGDRLLWTRVFVQPINFEFAGYTLAATDNKSIKLASIENSTNTKLSIKGGGETGVPGLGKPEVGQEIEKTQKATADVNEQYENLGIDIQPTFLRIIRESAPGGDVAGNTAIQLSILTDPSKIWCEQVKEGCNPRPIVRPLPVTNDDADRDEKLVLVVSNAHLADGEQDPRINVLPQSALPHCPLKANVWMLYEIRNIKSGRQNYLEGLQQVELSQEGYNAEAVDIVPADDIAPAVWSIKVTDAKAKPPVTDDTPDLTAQIDKGSVRKLVFTDYLTTSELAHWLKTQMATSTGPDPRLKTMTFHVDSGKTLTPFKHVVNDCKSTLETNASK
jgi:hypothetical protein